MDADPVPISEKRIRRFFDADFRQVVRNHGTSSGIYPSRRCSPVMPDPGRIKALTFVLSGMPSARRLLTVRHDHDRLVDTPI